MHQRSACFRGQTGNALFLILIAVALFAALSYAVTQSGRGGGNANRETNALMAAQVLGHMSMIDQAINRLKLLNGCTNDTLDFRFAKTGNDNGDAPVDGSCNVFGTNGGDVPLFVPPRGAFAGAGGGYVYNMKSLFSVKDAPTGTNTCEDAFFVMGDVTLEFCQAMNTLLKNEFSIMPEYVTAGGLGISYPWGTTCDGDTYSSNAPGGEFGDSGLALTGKTAFCARATNASVYKFTYGVAFK